MIGTSENTWKFAGPILFLTGLIGGGIAAIGWQTAHPATWFICSSASARRQSLDFNGGAGNCGHQWTWHRVQLGTGPPQAPNAAAACCSWARAGLNPCMGPNTCQKVCQNRGQTECQTENVRLLEYMSDRMPEKMSEFMIDRMSLGRDHSGKSFSLGR